MCNIQSRILFEQIPFLFILGAVKNPIIFSVMLFACSDFLAILPCHLSNRIFFPCITFIQNVLHIFCQFSLLVFLLSPFTSYFPATHSNIDDISSYYLTCLALSFTVKPSLSLLCLYSSIPFCKINHLHPDLFLNFLSKILASYPSLRHVQFL